MALWIVDWEHIRNPNHAPTCTASAWLPFTAFTVTASVAVSASILHRQTARGCNHCLSDGWLWAQVHHLSCSIMPCVILPQASHPHLRLLPVLLDLTVMLTTAWQGGTGGVG